MPLATPKPARSLVSPNLHAGSTPQPPTFYPPSHYAAANGIPYPHKPHASPAQPSLASSSDQHSTAVHYEQFMPVSYTPDTSSSESSFEFRPSRQPPTNHSNHRSPARSSKSTRREKRQSQIAGLPQIEAHLLPSLRDTIVKMTRPPSRLAPLQSAFAPSDDLREPQHLEPYGNPDLGNHHDDFSSNAHHARHTQKYQEFLSPRDPPPSDDACSIKDMTPKLKSLGSTPRTPTPRPFQGQETPRSDFGINSGGLPSLRPVKSLLARKTSIKTTPTGLLKKPILKASAQTPRQKPISPVSSSLPNHGQPTNGDTPLPPAFLTNKNRSDSEAQKQVRSPQLAKQFSSNIPRLRARLTSNHAQYQSSDSSDFECRYERERRDQRKLTVTNADTLSNSSSSCESDESRRPLHPTERYPRVGLGLDYQFPEIKSPRVGTPRDGRDVCPDDSMTKTPRFSVASSDSCYSTASDAHSPPPERISNEHERRRAALLSIVSTLDQKPQRRATQSSESSEYHVVEGVAYSASGELEVHRGHQEESVNHSSGTSSSGPSHSTTRPTFSEPADAGKTGHREYRRRSQYMPGSLPLSIVDSLHQNSSQSGDKGKRESNEVGSATARLARRSLMVAARERDAFGLRPSDSEEYHQQYESLRHQHPRWESRLSESSVEDLDEPQENELSHGASYLFHSIQGARSPLEHNRSAFDGGVVVEEELPGVENHHILTMKSLPPSPPISSASHLHTAKNLIEEVSPARDIMAQLLETEEVFVERMQTCIQHYVLPLRIHGSRAWISGIPPEISRFLDWVEDILHLHEQVLGVFRGPQFDLIRQMSLFLPRFEIYQPYIARLGEVSQQLRRLMDEGSDLGCFVNLQDKEIQRTGWSLLRYISEPEKRLRKYLELFSALLELTPRQGLQYLPIFSLLRSMELIIDVMNTVKGEEEEHQMVSSLLGRFKGPRSLDYLADRKRFLLWHGPLALRWPTNMDQPLESNKTEDASRTRRLSRAVNAWDRDSSKAPCVHGPRDSISSYGSTSSYSSSDGDSRDDSPDTTTLVPVYAVVFSDLVVFGEYGPGTSASYRLLDTIGLARVFSVSESGESSAMLIEVIPIDSANSNLSDMNSHIKYVQLLQSDSASAISSPRNVYQDCLSALRRSSDYTTRLWCRPWKASKTVEKDDTAQFLASLVDSGLPLPRSPSGHVPESKPRGANVTVQEREERGWWSFRFHQVMSAKRQTVSSST